MFLHFLPSCPISRSTTSTPSSYISGQAQTPKHTHPTAHTQTQDSQSPIHSTEKQLLPTEQTFSEWQKAYCSRTKRFPFNEWIPFILKNLNPHHQHRCCVVYRWKNILLNEKLFLSLFFVFLISIVFSSIFLFHFVF